MEVISKTTLVTGSDEGPVNHKPGTPVDIPKEDALDLIKRGLATEAPKAEPEDTDPLNINEATADEISKVVKGVGKKTAADIVASREADGPFESLASVADRIDKVNVEQLEAAGVIV